VALVRRLANFVAPVVLFLPLVLIGLAVTAYDLCRSVTARRLWRRL
jgi:hypothetical protein